MTTESVDLDEHKGHYVEEVLVCRDCEPVRTQVARLHGEVMAPSALRTRLAEAEGLLKGLGGRPEGDFDSGGANGPWHLENCEWWDAEPCDTVCHTIRAFLEGSQEVSG